MFKNFWKIVKRNFRNEPQVCLDETQTKKPKVLESMQTGTTKTKTDQEEEEKEEEAIAALIVTEGEIFNKEEYENFRKSGNQVTLTSIDPNGYQSGSEEAEDIESFVKGDKKSSSKSGSGGQKTYIYQEVPTKIRDNYIEDKFDNRNSSITILPEDLKFRCSVLKRGLSLQNIDINSLIYS